MNIHSERVAQSRVAFLLQDPHQGGIERCLINLACGLAARGIPVDLLVRRCDSPFLRQLEPQINMIRLASDGDAAKLSDFLRYCEQNRPAVLLSGKEQDGELALKAKPLLKSPPRICLGVHLNYTAQLNSRRAGFLRKRWRYRRIRRFYDKADTLVCVSAGVAEDISRILQKRLVETLVLPNAVITRDIATLAGQAVDHPWLAEQVDVPVLLGIGRMARIKNFPLLIQAFARVRAHLDCRLIILGDGRQRDRLAALARNRGVADDVDFPGFVENPYAFMAKSALFVLSSDWEGLPTVLIEALAVGTPVVATDCPSGPAEILQGGRIGRLVPIGDEAALAEAIISSLERRHDRQQLRDAVAPYSVEASCDAYIKALSL